MRKEGRRMAKCELYTRWFFFFFFFQERPLEETTGNVLVSLVHCKALPFAIETFSLLGQTAKQKSIYLSHVFHHFPCYFA